MKHTFITLSSVALVASALAQGAGAQTPLPAAVQADRAAIQQDVSNLHNAFAQLQTDEQAGNSVAADADRTAVHLARMQVQLDFSKLRQDAQGLLQPDQTALMAALTQLHADQVAGNASAIVADQTALQSAKTQLHTDHKAIFGDLGTGSGMRRHHWQG